MLQSSGAGAGRIEEYLERLRAGLCTLPETERGQAVEEARARIDLELELHGAAGGEAGAVEAVLAQLGPPEALAAKLCPLPAEQRQEPAAPAEPAGPLAACRACGGTVSTEAFLCPHCGAPAPARQRGGTVPVPYALSGRASGYEYKSERTLCGLPLVHVAFGRDENGRMRVARGFIAIGQFGIGAITIAQFGVGALFGLGQFVAAPLAIAQFALGLAAIGQFGIGLLFGIGMVATGVVAGGLVKLALFKLF